MLRQDPALRDGLATHLALLLEYNLLDPLVQHRCLAVADGRCARESGGGCRDRWGLQAPAYRVMEAVGQQAVKRGRCCAKDQMWLSRGGA